MTAPARQEQPWAQPPRDLLEHLCVEERRGLSNNEVRKRQNLHGLNIVEQHAPRSVWKILLAQFRSVLVGLLILSFLAALAFEEWVEAGAVAAVIVINAAIGFFTELKAARSMEALRKLGKTHATVRREGSVQRVNASRLVPGDIVLVEGGDVVSADLRVIKAARLEADESTLTGESVPSAKAVEGVAHDADIAERSSILYKGTVVTRGAGEGVVVATGMRSELGRIAHLVSSAESEETPLERKLNKLGQGLVWVTLAIAALVSISGVLSGHDSFLIIQTAIALAVAAVPEGLPVIATIALARGMRRMASRNALVNRLSAVETLGATSVICTDKTGTLTENRMRVVEWVPAEENQRTLIEAALLCNHAALSEKGDSIGDPTEIALLRAGLEGGVDRGALLSRWPLVREVPFDSSSKRMATVHGATPPYRIAAKGAPEAILPACKLGDEETAHWLREADRLAEQGLRVLGLASRHSNSPSEKAFAGLRWLGLVAMHDPPRAEVRDTISQCRKAGIRVVMVTGDHPVTARNIALATGLVDSVERARLGKELESLEDADKAKREELLAANIFARVSPEQKLRLISLHQRDGAIVAMTGDGVNDAPALRKADIGVAMGGRGTEAAREAAAMVLQDDNLATINVAIAEGRTIYDNIRRFVVYLLSCNVAEVLVVAIAASLRTPLPLLPLQILFLNLVTDVFPALALGVGDAADNVMERPPRPAGEPVLGKAQWKAISIYGAILTASTLGAFFCALHVFDLPQQEAVSISFLTISFGQLWHVFNMRARTSAYLRNEITRNAWIWAAIALCTVVLLLATYVQPLASVLKVVPPSPTGWLTIAGASLAPLLIGQLFNIRPAIESSVRVPRD